MRFEEVKASNLVTVDIDGAVIDDPLGLGINPAGFTIHGAIHSARPDVVCVLHTHTVAGVAVSCQQEGLLPLNQWSRSEEHTSELQSLMRSSYAVFCLKKNKTKTKSSNSKRLHQ